MNFEISQQLKKEEELLKLNKKSELIEELMKYKSRAAFSQANIERYQRTASFTFYELTADYEEELRALANATCLVEDIQTFSNDYGHSVIIKFVCRTHSDAEILFEKSTYVKNVNYRRFINFFLLHFKEPMVWFRC